MIMMALLHMAGLEKSECIWKIQRQLEVVVSVSVYIHQYQDLLYCNSSQYILSTYNMKHNNNNNVVLAMTMPYSGQGW
jgi:hypothetical protein